jgi:ribosomal protein L4
MKVKVQSLDAGKGGDIELNDEIFAVEPRADILHRVVTWQLVNRRAPARAARERSDVARTGKKFGRQKGGGTARHGDRKAPIFIGGGRPTVPVPACSRRASTRRFARWASRWRCRRKPRTATWSFWTISTSPRARPRRSRRS